MLEGCETLALTLLPSSPRETGLITRRQRSLQHRRLRSLPTFQSTIPKTEQLTRLSALVEWSGVDSSSLRSRPCAVLRGARICYLQEVEDVLRKGRAVDRAKGRPQARRKAKESTRRGGESPRARRAAEQNGGEARVREQRHAQGGPRLGGGSEANRLAAKVCVGTLRLSRLIAVRVTPSGH